MIIIRTYVPIIIMEVFTLYDYSKCTNRAIACLDLKSFYASCACVLRGLDPMKVKLAVVGDINRPGSIVLAATPELKKVISTGSRMYEIPKSPDTIIVNPEMEKYVQISNRITEIYLKYVAPEDLHTLSIDEAFLDLHQSWHLFGNSPAEVVKTIQRDIYNSVGIIASGSLAPNLFLAKVCLDNIAKKSPSNFAEWTYEDVQKKLWKISPLTKIWGIGKATEEYLKIFGVSTVGELAEFPIVYLIDRFGKVKANELHMLAHGIDESRISQKYTPKQTSINLGQTLLEDCCSLNMLKMLILEQVEEACYRLRRMDRCCRTIELGISYTKQIGGGFKRAYTLEDATCLTEEIYSVCLKLLKKFHTGFPVRQINISLKNLSRDDAIQISLFEDTVEKEKRRNLAKVMDQIRYEHGKNVIMRAISYTDMTTQRKRNGHIGGHSK